MDKATKVLETKIQLLQLVNESTEKIVSTGQISSMERHVKTITTKLQEVHDIKTEVQEMKIEKGEEMDDIRGWPSELDERVLIFEDAICNVNKALEALRVENTSKVQQNSAVNTETKTHQAKPNIKLHKIEMTKFNGTYEDWMRFWNQFEAEVHQAEIPPVTKFTYLKESVEPKVRAFIDGLPFTTEGYERARNILKSRFGKTSEIINACTQNIMSLPIIHGTEALRIHGFYQKLMSNVQALETLGKIKDVNGYVRTTLDKLEGIRGDLVRTDDNWQAWEFPHLVEALRKWTERNPLKPHGNNKPNATATSSQSTSLKRTRSYNTRQTDPTQFVRVCVYCDGEHKATECEKHKSIDERKKILSAKRLCFNCTKGDHRAAECKSKSTCRNCQRRHHTSICDKSKDNPPREPMLLAPGEGSVIYPVVVVDVEGVVCRALLDTGAGSSYASAGLLQRIGKQPVRTEHKRIDMMMCSTTQRISIYNVNIKSLDGKFQLPTTVSKVDKSLLLTIPNPNYTEQIKKYQHLAGVAVNDNDVKSELPIHMILGASEYSRIKTTEKPKVGCPGEPVAELTTLGWTMMSPGEEACLGKVFAIRSTSAEYEALCNLDVLGLQDRPDSDQQIVYDDFVEQLEQSDDGWYQTGLLWKPGHKVLPTNEHGSIRRLQNLLRKLQGTPNLLDEYDNIIQQQLEEGVIERVEGHSKEKEFYIPHKPVVRESAETTKVRIVYDASAKASENGPSLNDCLETGPPLQNLLWDVLVRNRFKPVALAADLKQAFLQVRIRPEDRDVLRFHWIKDKDPSVIEVLRFTRALFGLVQSPFLLAGTLKGHLAKLKKDFPEEVEEIEKSMYVDDLITGGSNEAEVGHLKKVAVHVFEAAKFTLHKWHSNEPQLEGKEEIDELQSYAKQQLGVQHGESKILGLQWDKHNDTVSVALPDKSDESTKREVLRYLASVYDPLGLVSPVTLVGKLMYREACDSHLAWDEKLSDNLAQRWYKFLASLPNKVDVNRALPMFKEPIEAIALHAFGDASSTGVSAAVYAVIKQMSGISQGLVAANSRLAKKNLTIPRLELVAAHMAANLVGNVRSALEGHPVKKVQGWLDSTVALHWIKGGGSYKQFVANRVQKINEKDFIEWRHVSTDQNPADLGSRGCHPEKLTEAWFQGPDWLSDTAKWPSDAETQPTKESEDEARKIKELFSAAVKENDDFDELLQKHTFWRAVRITAWIKRFVYNCRNKKSKRIHGPLTTTETHQQVTWWIKREQEKYRFTDKFKEDQLRLNLQLNQEGVFECRGRIQGCYPIYLPPRTLLSEKIVQDSHWSTLHGGVGLTMSHVRETFWVPRLRYLIRQVIKDCYGCKKFQITAFNSPPPGILPTDRTEGSTPFEVIGVDYAGPIMYKEGKGKEEKKAYILLLTCSLTRAVHIELLPDQSVEEFLPALKRFIARRGRPRKIYSDNAKTFVAAEKWLRDIMNDERTQDYLAHQSIVWQFNLSRAPWWGGQFERLVGIVKQALYKSVGRALLTWKELEELMLDIEVAINNRPLTYVEDDVQLPVLTPSLMVHGKRNLIPEQDTLTVSSAPLRNRAKYLVRCKDVLWSRWTKEYIRSLREQHNLNHKTKDLNLKTGDVVLIQGDQRNRGKWNIGVVDKLIKGRDGLVRVVRLRAGKSYLERTPQHLYPMELSCDRQPQSQLQPTSREFHPRAAAQEARQRIQEIAEEENQEL